MGRRLWFVDPEALLCGKGSGFLGIPQKTPETSQLQESSGEAERCADRVTPKKSHLPR